MEEKAYCSHCGKEVSSSSLFCPYCGEKLTNPSPIEVKPKSCSALTASLLSIFLGGYGAGNFYLGNTGKAIAQLILGLLIITLPVSAIWGIVEGVLIMSNKITKDGKGKLLNNDI